MQEFPILTKQSSIKLRQQLLLLLLIFSFVSNKNGSLLGYEILFYVN